MIIAYAKNNGANSTVGSYFYDELALTTDDTVCYPLPNSNNSTLLLLSSELGLTPAVDYLLKNNENTEITLENGRTPLMLAVDNEHGDIAELLLKSGADVNKKANDGTTALTLAIDNQQQELEDMIRSYMIIDYAKKNGADSTVGSCFYDELALTAEYTVCYPLPNSNNSTLLLLSSELGLTPAVDYLLKNNANTEITLENGRTPLMLAVINGQAEAVKLLFNAGAKLKENDHIIGLTPLVFAAMNGYTKTAKELINKGVNVDSRDFDDKTALMWAADNGHMDTAELLIDKGASLYSADISEYTAIIYAVQGGHKNIVELLVNKGKTDVINVSSIEGTALMHAVQANRIDILDFLLNNNANVDHSDSNDWTAVMEAAECGYEEMVQLLISFGANLNQTSNIGKTALLLAISPSQHIAAQNGSYTNIIQSLIKNGADVYHAAKNGDTAISLTNNNDMKKLFKLGGLTADNGLINADDAASFPTPLAALQEYLSSPYISNISRLIHPWMTNVKGVITTVLYSGKRIERTNRLSALPLLIWRDIIELTLDGSFKIEQNRLLQCMTMGQNDVLTNIHPLLSQHLRVCCKLGRPDGVLHLKSRGNVEGLKSKVVGKCKVKSSPYLMKNVAKAGHEETVD